MHSRCQNDAQSLPYVGGDGSRFRSFRLLGRYVLASLLKFDASGLSNDHMSIKIPCTSSTASCVVVLPLRGARSAKSFAQSHNAGTKIVRQVKY